METSRKMKRGDFVTLAFAGVVAGALFLWNSTRGMAQQDDVLIAEIRQDGKLIREIDLHKIKDSKIVQIEGAITVVIEAQPGRIRFQSSECPDQVCVHTGWLTQQGQLAACLPSKTIVTI
ncbi:NusG domain II-containing protein [Desulfuribacillus alkaliarsenatis]|uniref:Uncharacterized protein n=1 Tax=Desulfuribacillus alkaliarsenatis TaxID=766136 RepID=A0A1E5G670_9FIRM|nr:NusG domain II-containing protein [Desulfuribacillus alkaliarsenatis]OEF98653.1 hypothetical protein BHF68_03035 [Desulfuribacillus alkaliarsenatis]